MSEIQKLSVQLYKKNVYGKEFRFDIPLAHTVHLPHNWTAVMMLRDTEGVGHEWLHLLRGRVLCYTDMGCLPYEHVTSVPFSCAAYMHYFFTYYDVLPEYVVTGHFPFDHNPDYLQHLASCIESPPSTVISLGNHVVKWGTRNGQGIAKIEKKDNKITLHTFGDPSKAPVLPLWCSLFKTPMPDIIPVMPLLQSIVPAKLVRMRSRQFWKRCFNLYQASGIEHLRHVVYSGNGHHDNTNYNMLYAWEPLWPSLFDPAIEAWPHMETEPCLP